MLHIYFFIYINPITETKSILLKVYQNLLKKSILVLLNMLAVTDSTKLQNKSRIGIYTPYTWYTGIIMHDYYDAIRGTSTATGYPSL